MPMIIIRRVPLPSVSIYLILSASLLMLAVMWANNTLVEEQELLNATSAKEAVKSKDVKQLTNNKNPEQSEFCTKLFCKYLFEIVRLDKLSKI